MMRVNEVIVSRIAGRNTSPRHQQQDLHRHRVALPAAAVGLHVERADPGRMRAAQASSQPRSAPARRKRISRRAIAPPPCGSPRRICRSPRGWPAAARRARTAATPRPSRPRRTRCRASDPHDHQPLARAQRQRAQRSRSRARCRSRRPAASGASPRSAPHSSSTMIPSVSDSELEPVGVIRHGGPLGSESPSAFTRRSRLREIRIGRAPIVVGRLARRSLFSIRSAAEIGSTKHLVEIARSSPGAPCRAPSGFCRSSALKASSVWRIASCTSRQHRGDQLAGRGARQLQARAPTGRNATGRALLGTLTTNGFSSRNREAAPRPAWALPRAK